VIVIACQAREVDPRLAGSYNQTTNNMPEEADMAKVIDPQTGDLYTHCTLCGVEIEEAGIRSHSIQDECLDCADESDLVFDDPAHAWNQAMNLIRAYVRSLDSLDGYEFEGTEETPELRIFEGASEEDHQAFTDALRGALERRAEGEGL
jgi:hypothetical protein